MAIGLSISIAIIIIVGFFLYRSAKRNAGNYIVPDKIKELLEEHVAFYSKLDNTAKALFETRVKDFLTNVAVRGVGVEVEDLDRVLVGAGAIIPIFAFPDWRYNNLAEVLLYAGAFTRDFKTKGGRRDVLGMVGDGAMHREMILSQPSLRASFQRPGDGTNTAIHEFVHLTIGAMKSGDNSDINRYGATNEAEFFAVVTEYFFERPEELQAHHPELFALLEGMFVGKK
jgi:Mlc titration factor MtfA (ptsG expression regulator)